MCVPRSPIMRPAVAKRSKDVCVWASVSERSALALALATLARQIAQPGKTGRTLDQEMLDCAAKRMNHAGSRIDVLLARSESPVEQDRELNRHRVAFAVVGLVLCAVLPGTVARSIAVSWAKLERIAARMLGNDIRQAGQGMMIKSRRGHFRPANNGR